MRNAYVYAIIFGFGTGILLRSIFDFGISFAFLFVFLAGVAYVLRKGTSTISVTVVAIVLVSASLGYARMHAAVPNTLSLTEKVGGEVVLEGVIIADPDRRARTQNLVVKIQSGERVLVRADTYADVSYGDTIRVTGTLEAPENFEGDTGRIFNYRGFLAKDKIFTLIAFPELEVLESGGGNVVYNFLFGIKNKYLDALAQNIPEPSAALAGGITVGDKQALGGELQDDFRKTGLIHIVVLSGYNVTIIVVFFTFLFMWLPRNVGFALAALGIILFTLLVGASATVVRAALMGIIASVAIVTGRTYGISRALFVAGFLMLLWNPYLLAFDPSFQLSFIATLGLIFGTPLLTPYLPRVPEMFHLREITAATIATQIAVVPALIYMMGEVSLVALPVNLLVLPIIPLAMIFVFAAGALGALGIIANILALPFAWIAHALLLYVLKIVEVFASLPFVSVSVPEISIWIIVGVYALLGLFVFRVGRFV